ncbi:MAG: hypothetical protein LWW85_15780 [Marinilabiliales bacterium]|nr:hypothetical protein [Marinilabiliales bacterium]
MKTTLFSLLGILLLAACQTIEERDALGTILAPSDLKIAIVQNPAGSNKVVLQNKTPGTIMFFDYGTGTTHRAIDTIYIPFAGKYTLKYTAFCDGGTVSDSTTFTIASNDNAFFDKDPAWKGLTNGGSGQTWVWAVDHPSGFIAGNGPEDCTFPAWWTMTADQYWGTKNDEVYIDLVGAANFQHKNGDGSVTKGFFNVIAPFVINGNKFSGIETLGGPKFPWPDTGKYHITKNNANELTIHEYGAYNVALYKRKGFKY